MSIKVKYDIAMQKDAKEFYTPTDLAKLLSVNVMTIYRYIKAKRLKAHKIGKEYRVDRTEFQRFLDKTSTT